MATPVPKGSKTIKSKAQQPDAVASFIQKSYQLLEDNHFPDIVDWNAEGTAIIIKKPLEFGQTILPAYFKHSNLTSFVRQLNMYDFRKRRTQNYEHSYYHDLFQRGKKQLLAEIRRKKDTGINNVQKAIDALGNGQSEQLSEPAMGLYENHLLKKVSKDALSKIDSLESKIKDLTTQNQSLWTQLNQQTKKEDILVSVIADFMKKKGITTDHIPKIINNQFNLPAIKLENGLQPYKKESIAPSQVKNQIKVKTEALTNVGDFFNFGESDEFSNSTEGTCFSPQSKTRPNFDISCSEKIDQDLFKPFSKRRLSFEDEGPQSIRIEKMLKTETSNGRLDFMNPFNVNMDIDNGGDMWRIKQDDDFYRPTGRIMRFDSYLSEGLDLMNFH